MYVCYAILNSDACRLYYLFIYHLFISINQVIVFEAFVWCLPFYDELHLKFTHLLQAEDEALYR